ncbi:MAG: hypothetical protein WAN24_17260 [Candidatus Acidiferrales bacterium]
MNVVTFGVGPAVNVYVVAAVGGSAVKVPCTLAPVPFVVKVDVFPPVVYEIVVFVCGAAENVAVA